MTKNDRLAGMVLGSLVADSLALGAHWEYDQAELERAFGRVTELRKPLSDSYHPTKEAGEQTHYGDQTLVLLESVAAMGGYDHADFAARWRASWEGYGDYFDHATKGTLENLEKGVALAEAASDSEELGGASRLAPLLAVIADQPLEARIVAARQQTGLTHGTPIALDAAEFFTRLVDAILAGHEVNASITEAAAGDYNVLDVGEVLARLDETRELDLKAAAKTLGLACPAEQAIPTVLAILARHSDDLETALIENVMAGGDSAARALALGMILGAKHGRSAIPARWLADLQAHAQSVAFVQQLS